MFKLIEKLVCLLTGSIAHISAWIEEDFRDREIKNPHILGLADLVSCALLTRCANTAVLPRKVSDVKSKEQYMSHFLSNRLIDPIQVMRSLIPEVTEMMASQGWTIILMLDQRKIAHRLECLDSIFACCRKSDSQIAF